MEKFDHVTVHRSMPSVSPSASPSTATQRFSVILVVLSLASIHRCENDHRNNCCTHVKHNDAAAVSCTTCSVQALSPGEKAGKVKAKNRPCEAIMFT